MKEAFLQNAIYEKDGDVTRFLFTEDPFNDSAPLHVFRFTRVLFGLNCGPFLLAATIKYHLRNYQKIYPDAVKFLNKNIYVFIESHPSIENAIATSIESMDILVQ